MRRSVLVLFVLGILVAGFAGSAAIGGAAIRSANVPSELRPLSTRTTIGGTKVVTTLSFDGPREVQFFTATVSEAGTLVVDTKDCCLRGDHWLVTLIDQAGGGTVGAVDEATAACGNGSIREFSGQATMRVRPGSVKVLVAYCSGIDDFPAGMTVRFRFDGPMTVSAA
jgi:hypothetical protein